MARAKLREANRDSEPAELRLASLVPVVKTADVRDLDRIRGLCVLSAGSRNCQWSRCHNPLDCCRDESGRRAKALWLMETAVRIAQGFLADDSISPEVIQEMPGNIELMESNKPLIESG